MKRTATAHWEGDLKSGKGHLSTQSTVLNKSPYSFNTRFENGPGTNPEELLAAAHGGCFTMSVGNILGQAGTPATSLDTIATVTLEGGSITAVHLSIKGRVPTISPEKFIEVTKSAEKNCLVSRVLSIPITSDAELLN